MTVRTTRFYSHGKLLLSAEYLILDGATGLALPTKYGQSLEVTPNTTNTYRFTSTNHEGTPWFTAELQPEALLQDPEQQSDQDHKAILNTNDRAVALTLLKMLREILRQQPGQFTRQGGADFNSRLEFPGDWGLGSSSTFINNLAQWSGTDPYAILRASLGGSGYDIACAGSASPLTYALNGDLPKVNTVTFAPPFKEQLYFIHLNKKQNSRQGIARYRALKKKPENAIRKAGEITQAMLDCTDLELFGKLMIQHETLIGNLLNITPVKELLFHDYPGQLKSLGAWGGDFILATATTNPEPYFKSKGYTTVIPYREMIL